VTELWVRFVKTRDSIPSVLELGCGVGALSRVYPGYIGLDLSFPALKNTDWGAFTSMYSHAAIVYFSTRRWRVLSHRSVMSRLLCRHQPVVVQTPSAACRVEKQFASWDAVRKCSAIPRAEVAVDSR
jgi:hypothetical protein